jgi:hypothetical protein
MFDEAFQLHWTLEKVVELEVHLHLKHVQPEQNHDGEGNSNHQSEE